MAVTDKFRLASGSTRPVVTSLSLPKANGATTAEITSATGWNTTTGVDVVIYRRQLNTTTGKYEKVDGTQTDWVAQLTGTTLSGMVLAAGTEPASGYAADGNTVVMCSPTAQWGDDLVTGILAHANQDGSLKTAAVQTALGITASPANGWDLLNAGVGPNTVTDNGNGSYDLVFNGVDLTSAVSPGMRLRSTRTVAAPTQSASLNGTSQYFSKTSPAGMTFTDDFVAGAWVKLSSYAAGTIISRYNGTSGWRLLIDVTGQVILTGWNASSANFSQVFTYQSVPLNKWVHIAAQLDMSAFTTHNLTPNTSYIMLNGVDAPASVSRGGTNPTALVQAGNFEVGSVNGGTLLFPGKIAQAFVSSAKITQANVRAIRNQGLTSALISANNIVSAYSHSNALNDLNTTNANNLTANGSATTTNADAPWGQQADSTISSGLDYMIAQKTSFSTNTTITVQVPEGCTIPTSGGISNVYYSNVKSPYGFPGQRGKWRIITKWPTNISLTPSNATWYNPQSIVLNVPIGEWELGYTTSARVSSAASIWVNQKITLSTTTSSESNQNFTTASGNDQVTNGFVTQTAPHTARDSLSLAAATPYYLLQHVQVSSGTPGSSCGVYGIGSANSGASEMYAENAYL